MNVSLLLLLLLIWLVGLLSISFKKGIGLIWKISTILIFIFYCFWYMPEWQPEAIKAIGNMSVWAQSMLVLWLKIMPVFLLILWPIQIWQYQIHSKEGIEKRIRFLVLLTLFYWLLWFTCSWFSYTPESLMTNWIQTWHLPALPTPPLE